MKHDEGRTNFVGQDKALTYGKNSPGVIFKAFIWSSRKQLPVLF